VGVVKAVILVPRRDDNGPRDELWNFCRAWWEREMSHLPIIEGYHTDGLFNRSAAVNRAATIAGDWDVAVIIDSDVICNPERVREAIDRAHAVNAMVLPHTVRYDLSPRASAQLRSADPGAMFQIPGRPADVMWMRRNVKHTYSADNGHPSVSSVVVVPRRLWDDVGGFDEAFRGWGYEDTAFAAACETFGGLERMPGEVWHFWHPTAKEGKRGTPSWSANAARGQAYRTAIGDKAAIRALRASAPVRERVPVGRIPAILHRVVPEIPNPEADGWWARFEEMHPGWELRTHRDPLDPEDWPLTAPHWDKAANGAQFADMIRLEALLRFGGVYVDQDVEPLRPLDPLLYLPAFAAWEDERCVPNAVMGAVPEHPAIRACLDEMLRRIPGETWQAGPGVLTDILPGRDDVLLLPPGSFYAVHYRDPDRDEKMDKFEIREHPWAFVLHRYWGSWL
jgi:hypothetical protein